MDQLSLLISRHKEHGAAMADLLMPCRALETPAAQQAFKKNKNSLKQSNKKPQPKLARDKLRTSILISIASVRHQNPVRNWDLRMFPNKNQVNLEGNKSRVGLTLEKLLEILIHQEYTTSICLFVSAPLVEEILLFRVIVAWLEEIFPLLNNIQSLPAFI